MASRNRRACVTDRSPPASRRSAQVAGWTNLAPRLRIDHQPDGWRPIRVVRGVRRRRGRTGRSDNGQEDVMASRRWHLLLIVPVVVPLLVFLYNGKDPYLFGFPRFYWLQLAFILLGVGTTSLVYQMTKKRG